MRNIVDQVKPSTFMVLYATIELPLADGTVRRIRKPGRLAACQWDIYRKIGIHTMNKLPKTELTIPGERTTKCVVT